MKNNVICVNLWGKEICRLEWVGGYKDRFGKVGSKVSFNPQYHTYGYNLDPLGIYSTDNYMVRQGLSDLCRAKDYEGLPRFLSGSLPDDSVARASSRSVSGRRQHGFVNVAVADSG